MTSKKELRRQISQLREQLAYTNQLTRDRERWLRELEGRLLKIYAADTEKKLLKMYDQGRHELPTL